MSMSLIIKLETENNNQLGTRKKNPTSANIVEDFPKLLFCGYPPKIHGQKQFKMAANAF